MVMVHPLGGVWWYHFIFLKTWTSSFFFPMSIFLISTLSNVLDFQHVFCLLTFFWKKKMFYVLGTSHFIIKLFFSKGTKMERRNPRYFSLMFHPSFIHHSSLYNLKLLLLIWDIWFNVHCLQLTTHALAFSLESHRCSPSFLILLLHKIIHGSYWPSENKTLILILF
jgi:hypothetical protein